MSLPIAIVASGNGTNAQAMIDLMKAGVLDVDIRLIFCNRPGAPVLERARKAGVPSRMLDHTKFPDRASFDREMASIIKESGAELVVLAGYMRLLTDDFLKEFPHRVINIHPSILPGFGGSIHAGQEAVDYGVKLSGCTVHVVEMKVDSGPVIIQAAVPCNAGDSEDDLMTRVHRMEHRIYPQAVEWFAENRLRVEGRHVDLDKADKPLAPMDGESFVWPPLEKGF